MFRRNYLHFIIVVKCQIKKHVGHDQEGEEVDRLNLVGFVTYWVFAFEIECTDRQTDRRDTLDISGGKHYRIHLMSSITGLIIFNNSEMCMYSY